MFDPSARRALTVLAATVACLALLVAGVMLPRPRALPSNPASPICGVGADSVPQGALQARALADARAREGECDGRRLECQFTVWPASQGGGVDVVVERAQVDFEQKRCEWATDNEKAFHYAADGHLESQEGPHP